MAQEIVRLCDPCLAEDVRATGSPVTVALGSGKPVLLDLCEQHSDDWIKPLAAMLAQYGQPVATGAPTRKRPYTKRQQPSSETAAPEQQREHVCPFCEWESNVDSAFRRHLESGHNVARPLLQLMGKRCPLCGLERTGAGGSSLTAHVREEHGLASISRALAEAGDVGDPYGVRARVMSAGHAP